MSKPENVERITKAIVLNSSKEWSFSVPRSFTNLLDSQQGLVFWDFVKEKRIILGIPRSGVYALRLRGKKEFEYERLHNILDQENANILHAMNDGQYYELFLYQKKENPNHLKSVIQNLNEVQEIDLIHLEFFYDVYPKFQSMPLLFDLSDDIVILPNHHRFDWAFVIASTVVQERALAVYNSNHNWIEMIPLKFNEVFMIRGIQTCVTRDPMIILPLERECNVVYEIRQTISEHLFYNEHYIEVSPLRDDIVIHPLSTANKQFLNGYLNRLRSGWYNFDLLEVQEVTELCMRDVPKSFLGIINRILECLGSSEYRELVDEIGIHEFVDRIKTACYGMPEEKRYWYQRAILEELELYYLTGFDGNLLDYFCSVPTSGSFDTLKQYIRDRIFIDLEEQIKNSGPTIFLQLDKMKETDFSVLIPSILDRKRMEIESTVLFLQDDGCVDLQPLWITSYGYKILQANHCRLIPTAEQFEVISDSIKELGLHLTVTQNKSRVQLGVNMSKSMKEFIYYIVDRVLPYYPHFSQFHDSPWKRAVEG